MKRSVALVVLVSALLSLAFAASHSPLPVLPESLRWAAPPNIPGLSAAWILGDEGKPGPYILRVRLAANTRIPPHTHPDERNSTVLKGTIHVGFGETFDENKMVAVPAGAVYVAPANVPHYLWTRDGDAEYQEAGVGPTATVILKR